MFNVSYFLAQRLRGGDGKKKRASRPAVVIATAGVAIGLAVMIVSVGVVMGFKHTIRDKVSSFAGHIQISNLIASQGTDPYPVAVGDSTLRAWENIEGVGHAQRFTLTQGILKTDSDFLGVVFKGVGEEYRLPGAIGLKEASHVLTPDSSNRQPKLILSRSTADKLHVKAGEKIYAYFIGNDDVRARRFTIAGLYETNMSQFDENVCYTDLATAGRLNGWKEDQCSGAELTLVDFSKLDEVEGRVIQQVNRRKDHYGDTYTSQTVTELYPQIFSWLELLDVNIWIILGLMVCLAGFTMTSGLLIIILERTQTIGLLKALGARNSTIRHTFLWLATFIIGRGMLLGNLIGIGLLIFQRITGLVRLDPATYYVAQVPVELNLPVLLMLNLATLAVTVFMLIAPSHFASRMRPKALIE